MLLSILWVGRNNKGKLTYIFESLRPEYLKLSHNCCLKVQFYYRYLYQKKTTCIIDVIQSIVEHITEMTV